MAIHDDIRYIAVRINCVSDAGEQKQGTGTIIKDSSRYFVMTAAHCLKGKDHQRFQRSNIKISIILSKDSVIELEVDDVVEFEEEDKKDWALIEIKKPKVDFQYERVRRCYNAAENYKEEFFFYGFTELESAGALYRVENRSEAGGYWHLSNISIDGQANTAHELIDGNSGAGVFFQHGEILYFVGYVKELVNQNGAYSDFIMYDYPRESKFLTEDSIKNITLDVLKDWIRQLKKDELISAKSRLGEEHPIFLTNLERKMAVICSDDEDRARLTESHIFSYIEGNERMLSLLNQGNAFYEELNQEDRSIVKNINDNRKTKFATEESANADLTNVRNKYFSYAESKFKYDDEQKSVAMKYAAYRVAEKLMDCSIKYEKK